MRLQRLAAALALSAALLGAGCTSCHRPACPAPAPACGCNGPAGPAPANPYPPQTVTTPPPGAIIQRKAPPGVNGRGAANSPPSISETVLRARTTGAALS